MRNLIKAQKYQIKRDNGIIYIYLIGALYFVMFWADYLMKTGISEITGSKAALYNGEACSIVAGLLVALLACRIVGWDFNDKTLNYELMAGHSRAKVYWSRILVSVKWILVTVLLVLFVPMLIFGIMNGWGTDADMGGILLRHALTLFPLFRFFGICVLLTVVMCNCFMSMIIGYVLYEFSWVFAEMQALTTKVKLGVHLASTNVTRLLIPDKSGFAYIDGQDVVVYETVLEKDFILGTVGISLLVGMGCLLIGYRYFKKCDMN